MSRSGNEGKLVPRPLESYTCRLQSNMEPHGEDPDDASLDFLSPDFDPQRVLAVSPSKVQLPCPSVQPCDNLDTYDSIMLGTRKTFSAGDVIVKDVEDSGRKEVGVASSQQTTVTIMRQQIKTVLTFMETSNSGPMSLLQRCHSNQERVRVWVRHCAGVRGVCEGVVLAFDKHMNLVLGDVYEEYTPFRTVVNGGKTRKKKKKRQRKAKEEDLHPAETPLVERKAVIEAKDTIAEKTEDFHPTETGGGEGKEDCTVATEERLCRHLNQLFIRGDNVVVVAPTASHRDKDFTGGDRDVTTVNDGDRNFTTVIDGDRDVTTDSPGDRDVTAQGSD